MTNWGDRTAAPTDISEPGPTLTELSPPLVSNAGGRRTRKDVGIMIPAAIARIYRSAARQSWREMSQPARGDMVIGAMPIPADTNDTARLRWVSNQPVTVAIMGAKMAEVAVPTR